MAVPLHTTIPVRSPEALEKTRVAASRTDTPRSSACEESMRLNK